MTQAEVFYRSEGNAWLNRNTPKLPIKNDLVIKAFDQIIGGLNRDNVVLEIGCANGWRLKEIEHRYGCLDLTGIDPSAKAIAEAKKKGGIHAVRGFAHSLPFAANSFDVVIYGFCLYLCDRQSLFTIAAEGDRVLSDGGLMVIYDFATPQPCKNKYKHKDGIWSYKQNYEDMFLCNPAYSKIISVYHPDGQTKAVLMRKSLDRGWPEQCE